MPATPESEQLDLLMPLLYFYARDGLVLPLVDFISGDEMPEPSRHLLVHPSDMTPRLRAFHQSPISLTVVSADLSADYVMRQVVLTRDRDRSPVEYGAIGIHLQGFPPPVRAIPHISAPRAYFEIDADPHIASLLDCQPGDRLCGRCNALSFPDGIVFADIVEILPPAR
jgi:hypothetical protein